MIIGNIPVKTSTPKTKGAPMVEAQHAEHGAGRPTQKLLALLIICRNSKTFFADNYWAENNRRLRIFP